MKYSALIQRHFAEPCGTGELSAPTHQARAVNPACMDELRLQVQLENGHVVECRFAATGCVPVLALGSWICEYAPGCTLDALKSLTPADIEEMVGGLPRNKQHAAYLLVEVLQAL